MFNNYTNITEDNILNPNYSFSSFGNFFLGGENEYIRLIIIIFIIISLILNVIIISIIFCRKNANFSLSGFITFIILVVNFLHIFSYSINWLIKNKNTEIQLNTGTNESPVNIGGLLFGNPSNMYPCKVQAFLLISLSMGQDFIINIFFAFVYFEGKENKALFIIMLFFIGIISPLALTFLVFNSIGINVKYCHLTKYIFDIKLDETNNTIVEYMEDSYYNFYKAIFLLIRVLNLIINVFFIIKGFLYIIKNKKGGKKNKKRDKINASLIVIFISAFTLLIELIFKTIFFINNKKEEEYISYYLLFSSLDSILIPFAFSIQHRIYRIYIYICPCLTKKFDNILDDNSLQDKSDLLNEDDKKF